MLGAAVLPVSRTRSVLVVALVLAAIGFAWWQPIEGTRTPVDFAATRREIVQPSTPTTPLPPVLPEVRPSRAFDGAATRLSAESSSAPPPDEPAAEEFMSAVPQPRREPSEGEGSVSTAWANEGNDKSNGAAAQRHRLAP